MNKVITINLNGRAYQLEEAGYEALKHYLDAARAALREDPDRDEIMTDFEQAVADKCDAGLRGGKNVVTAAEIEEIIGKMGPVHADGKAKAKEGAAEEAASGKASPKRLFRIREGQWIVGVCNGLAAYFNMDVAVMRTIFVVLAFLTQGAWILVYVVLSFVMRPARTEDEVAAAHGETPLTAQEFVDRARAEYAKFAEEGPHNKEEWKAKARAWKREWRAKKHEWRYEWRKERDEARRRDAHRWAGCSYGVCDYHGGPGSAIAMVFAGIAVFVLTILWVLAVWSFLTAGVIFGLVVGVGHPLWVTLLIITLIYFLLIWPFKMIGWHACGGYHHHRGGGGLFTLLFLILLFWLASLFIPVVHEWWAAAVSYLQTVR